MNESIIAESKALARLSKAAAASALLHLLCGKLLPLCGCLPAIPALQNARWWDSCTVVATVAADHARYLQDVEHWVVGVAVAEGVVV